MHKTAHEFSGLYNLPKDDLFQQAQYVFTETVDMWDPEIAKFTTYFYSRLKPRLLHYVHSQYRWLNKTTPAGDLYDAAASERHPLDVEGFLAGLGADARQLVMLFLDMPLDVDRVSRKLNGDWNVFAIKGRIRKHLRTLGWTENRITTAYTEARACFETAL